MTLKNGGNVLVPCYPSGVTYDLFECLSGHLENIGLGQVPLYFVSPVADSSLAYSNIYSEWYVWKRSYIFICLRMYMLRKYILVCNLMYMLCLRYEYNRWTFCRL